MQSIILEEVLYNYRYVHETLSQNKLCSFQHDWRYGSIYHNYKEWYGILHWSTFFIYFKVYILTWLSWNSYQVAIIINFGHSRTHIEIVWQPGYEIWDPACLTCYNTLLCYVTTLIKEVEEQILKALLDEKWSPLSGKFMQRDCHGKKNSKISQSLTPQINNGWPEL